MALKYLKTGLTAISMACALCMASCDDSAEATFPEVTTESLLGAWQKTDAYHTNAGATVDLEQGLGAMSKIEFAGDSVFSGVSADGLIAGRYELRGDTLDIVCGEELRQCRVEHHGFDTGSIILSWVGAGTVPFGPDSIPQKTAVTITLHFAKVQTAE